MVYLIIGNSAAGIFAADAIRKYDRQGEIVILSTEEENAYSRCLTTYYVSGQIEKSGMFIRPDQYYAARNINFRGGVRVTGIQVAENQVELEDGSTLGYDKLLIASGAGAARAPIAGAGEEEIHVMRTLADADKILAALKSGRKRVAVLGGGLVSLKTAGALAEHGVPVTIIVTSRHILSQQFDKPGADLIMNRLARNGVRFVMGASAAELLHDRDGACSGLRLDTGEIVDCDLVFMGKGVTPNSDFIPPEIEMRGKFVKVDKSMVTTVPNIYAAGDVAMSYDKVSGRPAAYAIWPNAAEQGAIAGANMAGRQLQYGGAVSMNSLHFFGLNAICGGDSRGKGPGSIEECVYWPTRSLYQKCVFAEGRLTGFILVGKTANAGVLMAHLGLRLNFEKCLDILDRGLVAAVFPNTE
ncbi:MAG: NAD(P)/FAD-dependent oxidoreductase [Syntrophomonadaceae bacterium]|nr:NAD(P)/FAD-dependent oxidoreductase [Syntrophomonadaceae bacterium]